MQEIQVLTAPKGGFEAVLISHKGPESFQTLKVLSFDPVMSNSPLRLKAQQLTYRPCPSRTLRHTKFAESQSLNVLSPEVDAKFFPFCENLSDIIMPPCPDKVLMGSIFPDLDPVLNIFQIFNRQSFPPVTIME